jgi:hypothetical protein
MTVIANDKNGDPIQIGLVHRIGRKERSRAGRDPLDLPDPCIPVPILIVQLAVIANDEN